MRSCYLSGPMRSKPQFNYPAFMDAAAKLRDAGWSVFNPAEMDLKEGGAPNLSMTVSEQEDYAAQWSNARHYAKRDLAVILDNLFPPIGDAIVVLPGWEESIGARAEVAVAKWLGLNVLTLEEALDGTAERS